MSFATDQEGWCAFHNTAEQYVAGCIQCPECWHIFKSAADVVRVELEEWASMWEGATPRYEDIHCCPLCCHDW